MKKILCIVLNDFVNDSRVHKTAQSLASWGHDVHVAALYNKNLEERVRRGAYNIHRIKLFSRPWGKHSIVLFIKYFEFFLRVILQYRKFSIFHCNDISALPIGVFAKFLNADVKVVYDAHEYETETHGLNGLRKKVVKFLEKKMIKYVDHVICVSDSIAEEYVRLYGIRKPSLVLNTPFYSTVDKKNLFRGVFGIPQTHTIFLYQGGLSKGRGIELLLNAFSGLQDKSNVLICMGYGPLERVVQEAANVNENIYYHPAVNQDKLLDYSSSADYGIVFTEDTCLNHRYCLPNKVFEYLMAEIPVIASNLYELERLVNKYQVGLVANNNEKDLRLVISSSHKFDMSVLAKNIQNAKSIYNWERQEIILKGIYDGL